MNVLFFGAGAIGTYIGGSLMLSGHSVRFVEQPGPARLLRERGLRLEIEGRNHALPAGPVHESTADALREFGAEVIVFALKSFDTPAAVDALLPLRGHLPPALSLQNGVENEPELARAFGAGNVIAGTVTSAVGRAAAGEIRLERKRGLGVAAGHPLSAPLASAFARAGLNARLYPHAAGMKWSKMLTNLLANASSAILGMTPLEIFSHPKLFEMETRMLRECLAVMRARNAPLTDLPGTPVRLLGLAAERIPAALARPFLARAVGGGRGAKMPSFYLDLESGRGQTEVRYLNGAVDRLGREAGVEAPVNRGLTAVLEDLAAGRAERSAFARNPGVLLGRPEFRAAGLAD